MLKIIDISNWQDGFDLEAASHEFDGCIVKATEGIGYVDPCCDGFVQQLKGCDKLWGFYHFARENEPEIEAEFFWDNCRNYFGEGIPVLDYETLNYNDVEWCERFINKLHELSGIWAMLYISASQCSKFEGSWIPNTCGLWVAGYPYAAKSWTYDSMPYDIYPWDFCAMWQFTSSLNLIGYWNGLDASFAYMDENAWHAYAGTVSTDNPPIVENPNTQGKTIDDLALEVVLGEYGNGDDRKNMLGDKYEEVQNRVDELYAIANEVIEGKWGNGWNRETALNGAGYPYQIVQKIVNNILA